MTLEFERLNSGNAHEFYALERSAFSDARSEEGFMRETENPIAHYLLARMDGTAVGYAGYLNIQGDAQVMNVCTREDFRRRGIGRALMEYLIDDAAHHGVVIMTLEVRESNTAARMLYKRLGFYEVGRRRNYYKDPIEDAVLMDREIDEIID